jgi:eukaryotic-like serine/threonine-protein kinase
MQTLERLIREVHRRSLWQVLAVYSAGSWVAIQVVGELTRSAGLPDWVPPAALVLLIIGLPIVMATAVVQEGGPVSSEPASPAGTSPAPASPESASEAADPGEGEPSAPGSDRGAAAAPPSRAASPSGSASPSEATPFLARHLTWRRAILGGVAAFALLGVVVTGYFVMRVVGIGPVASLVAQGAIEVGEPIVLADFVNATDDPRLGPVVTGALRTDLAASPMFTLVSDGQVRQALRRMEREPDMSLDGALAREVALREGVKAVLDGEIGAAGSGFIITAALRAAEDGRVLAPFRRTARDPDEVIDAIDALSRDIREKAGESLRAIRSGPPLSQVTTRSLDALQRFTEGERLFDLGDENGAIALLEQAVALDPEFAMAWRKLAVTLGNLGIQEERRTEAVERAYALRERLTEVERYLAEALYHGRITEDREAEQRAYENVLRLDPLEPVALNNLALIYSSDRRYDRAEELHRRSLGGRGEPSGLTHQNLITVLIRQGKLDEAVEVLRTFESVLPDDPRLGLAGFWALYFSGEVEEAKALARSLADNPDLPAARRRAGALGLSYALATQGRLAESDRRLEAAATIARSAFGPPAEYSDRMTQAGVVGLAVRDPGVAFARERRMWTSELADEIPPQSRPYGIHAMVRLTNDDAEGLREVLDQWEAALRELPEDEGGPGRALYRFWLDGGRDDPEAMLQALDRAEDEADCPRCWGDFRARFLDAAGRHQEALEEWQALRTHPLENWNHAAALVPVAHREAARLAEIVGDTATAIEAYQAFIDLWSAADPEFQPRVQEARERLTALLGSP